MQTLIPDIQINQEITLLGHDLVITEELTIPEGIFVGWRQFAVMVLPDLEFGVVAAEPVFKY